MAEQDYLRAVIGEAAAEPLGHLKRHPVTPAWVRDDLTLRPAATYAAHSPHLQPMAT